MRIVLDAMGTDNHPQPDVQGAVLAVKQTQNTIVLVGDENLIRRELASHEYPSDRIEIVHAEDVITMNDKPSTVGKQKPNSSMQIGMNLVRDGSAHGFVTAGNTGAAHAIAMLHSLKRIPGVKRPALSVIFPIRGEPVMFLDVGANTDSKPEWLLQYALMGSIYSRNVLNVEESRIGLLSNGEEAGKGNQLVTETRELLVNRTDLNFVGNVEPDDILNGDVDVVVTDGFSGNILIKTFEATVRYVSNNIRDELARSPVSIVGGLLSRGAFKRVRNRVDSFEVGGAPLLGVNGVVIIAHGRSDARAIKNAIVQAQRAVEGNTVSIIAERVAQTTSDTDNLSGKAK
jgi:glycerol-3-phosphate acyltransferase PlsX